MKRAVYVSSASQMHPYPHLRQTRYNKSFLETGIQVQIKSCTWAFQRESDFQRYSTELRVPWGNSWVVTAPKYFIYVYPYTFQKSLSPQVAGFCSAAGHGFALGNFSIMQKAGEESWRSRERAFFLPCLAGVSKLKASLKKYFARATCNGLVKQAYITASLHHATPSPRQMEKSFSLSCLMLLFSAVVRNWLIATFGQSWEAKP